MDADLFPELVAERAHLSFARRCRDAMIQRFRAVDPSASADEVTSEYVEVTVAEALEDLTSPGAGDFFGRITDEHADRWYIGRRHIEDDAHDPVVVDWRAPIAAPFYRATGLDPLGLSHRRRFTTLDGELSAYLDEQLDDPESVTATGVPDPVLAEIGAARTGAMREIVATIQAEQDVVIRAPLDQCLIVQGGPGTGKTAVGLHRAAFLLFEHRRRLARNGVLVVGPNSVFLDYIANVLPSLGERLVQQRTALDICVPKVEIRALDDDATRRWKGAPEMLDRLAEASVGHIVRPSEDLRLPIGSRTLEINATDFAGWVDEAIEGVTPVNKRRDGLKGLVQRELLRRTDRDDIWERSPQLRAAVAKSWPTQQPIRMVDKLLPGPWGKRRAWSVADQFLVDEANSMLNGTPFTFGHVIVDEAQDHSAVSLRVIGRRSPQGSMTILGDLAQSTTPAGQQDWNTALRHIRAGAGAAEVAVLTIGYRVPGPILDAANRLLPYTEVSSEPSRSVRLAGAAPVVRLAEPGDLTDAVAREVVAVRHRHHNTGVVAPAALHRVIGEALAVHDLRLVDHVHDLAYGDVPVFSAEAVKGLEFDGVVVVNAHQIFDGSALGARLLYVAMTRAVQVVHLVGEALPPAELELSLSRSQE